MPKVVVEIDVEILDYPAVLRLKAGDWGDLAAKFARLPMASGFIKDKIDVKIRDILLERLEEALPREISAGLEKEGVQNRVKVRVA